ncbi:MAG: nucleotide exchange factor GrpE [Clostridia bacterium]|nr:nucleotide exchange factor GrpE [Clostridia bacterium]
MKDKEKTKAEQAVAEEATEAKQTSAETGDTPADETDTAPDTDPIAKELDEAKAQLAAEKDKYLRMAAEYDNYRRRTAKEREAAYTDAYADALMQIIPVIDNLERAAAFGNAGDAKQLSDGVNMILSQFGTVLEKMGIEAFGENGESFDPNIHNAIMHEEDPEQDENVIAEVFQRGYRKGDKIIRCAMVKVIN